MVHPADLPLILKEESWPADTRWVLAAFLASDEGMKNPNATPRFILAKDNKIIFTATGNAGWKEKMWPKVLEVTETKV